MSAVTNNPGKYGSQDSTAQQNQADKQLDKQLKKASDKSRDTFAAWGLSSLAKSKSEKQPLLKK